VPTARRPSRREFLGLAGAAGLAVVAAACKKNPVVVTPTAPAAPDSIKGLERGATRLSFLSGYDASTPLAPGTNRIGFLLSLPPPSTSLLTGGSPQVWAAQDDTSRALGPFAATWYPGNGYAATGDRSPKSPIAVGVFAAEVDLPQTGTWLVTATADVNGQHGTADPAVLTVITGSIIGAPGSKAISVPTPVATTDAKIAAICTRQPVCHLHAISLDAALRNGKPTVAVFATPLLCQSQLCGPVTDEVILVAEKLGSKANFIHVEEFLPGPDHKPDANAGTAEGQSPAFKAWHLLTEPWVFVMDPKGTITFSAFGMAGAPEIEAAVRKLL